MYIVIEKVYKLGARAPAEPTKRTMAAFILLCASNGGVVLDSRKLDMYDSVKAAWTQYIRKYVAPL